VTVIAGAIQYLNSAKLANKQGRPAVQTTLANNMSTDILDIGRRAQRDNGIGLSARSRAITKDFLNKSTSGVNAIFGMSTIGMSSIENMQLMINAKRASLPQSQIAESLRTDTSVNADPDVGNNVDTTA